MIYHIVMWNFKKDIKDQDRDQLKSDMAVHLEALAGKIPGLLTVHFIQQPFPSSTHEMALVTTFAHAEDIPVYAGHPEHVKAADTYVRPYTCDRACLDFEL